jgi:glutaminyl-peptide cyclotransferase
LASVTRRLSDDIVQIDPATGKVVAFYDFSALYPASNRHSMDEVLNGIAYDPDTKYFYLTGKLWPKYYKVAFCDSALLSSSNCPKR